MAACVQEQAITGVEAHSWPTQRCSLLVFLKPVTTQWTKSLVYGIKAVGTSDFGRCETFLYLTFFCLDCLKMIFFFFLLACADEHKLKIVLTLWCFEVARASLAINLCKSSIKWSLEQESESGEDNLRVGKNPQRFALCLSHSPWGHSPLTHTCTHMHLCTQATITPPPS